MKQLENSVNIVMKFLNDEDFSTSVIYAHRKFYEELCAYLLQSGKSYSPDIAYQWIEEKRSAWPYYKYTNARHCVNQLEDIRKNGYISANHLSCRKPAYGELNEAFKATLDELIETYHASDDRYRLAGARFFLYLQGKGLSDPSELNYDVLLAFYEEDYHSSWKSKDVYESLIRKLLRHLADGGVCSPGMSLALNKLLIHQIIKLSDKESCICDGKEYPSVTLSSIDSFLEGLARARYSKTIIKSSRHILTLLYIFMDMHNAILSDGLLWYWFGKLKPLLGTGWKQHRRSLSQFLLFLMTGSIITAVTGDPQRKDPLSFLPPGLKEPLEDYLSLLKREGWQPSTITLQRSSNLRFCRYLLNTGIDSFSAITPSVLKDFNLSDTHDTPEGKAAYNCRIRSFIIYLYEQGLVENPYLYSALTTVVSPRVPVVKTLSEEEVSMIWSVDPDALSPKALRDYAIICIGLSMGFRASDITGLRFENIDWKNRSINIIQQKTGKALTMPMPVKTGNVLFRYLRDGRPKSDEPYVFICHEAPYGRATRTICRNALTRFIGSTVKSGRSFHAVRKTFASHLLKGNTTVELITDSLGHSTDTTVHKYLSLDEKRMRMCSLSLADAGISFNGGAFNA